MILNQGGHHNINYHCQLKIILISVPFLFKEDHQLHQITTVLESNLLLQQMIFRIRKVKFQKQKRIRRDLCKQFYEFILFFYRNLILISAAIGCKDYQIQSQLLDSSEDRRFNFEHQLKSFINDSPTKQQAITYENHTSLVNEKFISLIIAGNVNRLLLLPLSPVKKMGKRFPAKLIFICFKVQVVVYLSYHNSNPNFQTFDQKFIFDGKKAIQIKGSRKIKQDQENIFLSIACNRTTQLQIKLLYSEQPSEEQRYYFENIVSVKRSRQEYTSLSKRIPQIKSGYERYKSIETHVRINIYNLSESLKLKQSLENVKKRKYYIDLSSQIQSYQKFIHREIKFQFKLMEREKDMKNQYLQFRIAQWIILLKKILIYDEIRKLFFRVKVLKKLRSKTKMIAGIRDYQNKILDNNVSLNDRALLNTENTIQLFSQLIFSKTLMRAQKIFTNTIINYSTIQFAEALTMKCAFYIVNGNRFIYKNTYQVNKIATFIKSKQRSIQNQFEALYQLNFQKISKQNNLDYKKLANFNQYGMKKKIISEYRKLVEKNFHQKWKIYYHQNQTQSIKTNDDEQVKYNFYIQRNSLFATSIVTQHQYSYTRPKLLVFCTQSWLYSQIYKNLTDFNKVSTPNFN